MFVLKCFFVSDLHGNKGRYGSLFSLISGERPEAVFMGGDLLPGGYGVREEGDSFLEDYLFNELGKIIKTMSTRFFVILGNDDPRIHEHIFKNAHEEGIIDYVHERTARFEDLYVTGYSHVPPTPFSLKDWERYDVSRYVDPGCTPPEEGLRTVPLSGSVVKYATMAKDLERLGRESPPERTIFLFHSPPYGSKLDRAAMDGRMIDHVPADVHVGSIAIQRFIEERQPLLTLHGHVHESAGITGTWRDRNGKTHMFTGAHDGPELALVRFDTADLGSSTRELIPVV